VAKVKIIRVDTVEVMTGRDKGMRGDVLRVMPKKGQVVVQGINVRSKHQRQVQAAGRTMSPGIIQFEAPIHISNVMLVCPKCGEPSRVGIERDNGESHRICKRCEGIIDA
jgi:large subunit ribosomal protein L24